MDETEGIVYESVPDSVVEDVAADGGAYHEAAAGTGEDATGQNFVSKLLSLESLLTEKLLSGNVLAVCMAVLIGTVLVFFMYKILSRQSRRDKAKEAKKKLKQQKNQKDSAKENKKKV